MIPRLHSVARLSSGRGRTIWLLSLSMAESDSGKTSRKIVYQTEIPRVRLHDAMRVPQAIADNYAKAPTTPLNVAAALDMTPTSGQFRELCGAAVGYGLTDGGPRAAQIAITDLGLRIISPLVEGDDNAAMQEAVLSPTIQRDFLRRYDGSSLPTESIAHNVLEDMGVPPESTERAYAMILDNARSVGFLKTIKDKEYVDLVATPVRTAPEEGIGDPTDDEPDELLGQHNDPTQGKAEQSPSAGSDLRTNRRVFISHGRNMRIVDQIKELLRFGDFEPVVSMEKQTVSKPVPDKVMDDMRASAAGIIHVSPEDVLLDKDGNERRVLNPNVLIEIGAAMALYGGRFILLVEEGASLPSNLQGLYEVRYEGKELGYDATMKVLKALSDFKSGGDGEG